MGKYFMMKMLVQQKETLNQKKINLIECEHKWVEALKKTFEHWKEKVIVEKMLGDTDDETYKY